MTFKDPPLVPREELPDEFHPHRSLYGKISNTLNGIDPTPPEDKSTVAMEMQDLEKAVKLENFGQSHVGLINADK